MSRLTEIGNAAMRGALLETLRANDWSLTRTANALALNSAANVIRAIKHFGLEAEYAAAKAKGLVQHGGRRPWREPVLPPAFAIEVRPIEPRSGAR